MTRSGTDANTLLRPFGELLREHRRAAGLSREELADRARLSARTISALELGTRQKPYRDTIAALADALELSADARIKLEQAALRRVSPHTQSTTLLLNLPSVVTPLVDRVDEVKSVLDLLSQYRLVTITGAGGVGKTRVSLAAGEQYAELMTHEVAFVDLSPLTHGALLMDAVGAVFGIPASDRGNVEAVARYFRKRPALLILDNCEHIVEDVASLANRILQMCPEVVILATSRERLDVPGEAQLRLPSLTYPCEDSLSAISVDAYSAIKLFVERAKAADPRFGLTDDNISIVADLCRRLEGIPLAIELAAARIPVLGMATLRARLDERLILTAPARGVPSRQTTVRATVAWSYGLLQDAERALLDRLSVFVGGFTLDAAERVCSGDPIQKADIADLLASLVNKSLVNVSLDVEPPRYKMLDSVRAYALEQLSLTGSSDAVRRSHAVWLADTARQAQQSRQGWSYEVAEFAAELSNVRAALQWGLDSEREEDVVTAGRVAGGWRRLWLQTGRHAECRFWSKSLIDRIDESRYPEVAAPLWAALLQSLENDSSEVEKAFDRAFPIFERIGDYAGMMHLRNSLSYMLRNRGEYARAERLLVDALSTGVTHHLERSPAYVHSLGVLADSLLAQRRSEEARSRLADAFTRVPANDRHQFRRWLLSLLAEVEFIDGNMSKAIEIAEDTYTRSPFGLGGATLPSSLSAYHLINNNLAAAVRFARDVITKWPETDSAPWAIQYVAAVAALQENPIAAATLLGFVEEWRDHNGYCRASYVQDAYELLIRALRERLSDATIEELMTKGRALTPNQAMDEALQVSIPQF